MARRPEEEELFSGLRYATTRRRGVRPPGTDTRPTRFLVPEPLPPDDLPCGRNSGESMSDHIQPYREEAVAVPARHESSRKKSRCIPPAPQSFVVQVEPIVDCDDPNPCNPDYLICNKYYYMFEKKPFRLRFLDYVRQPPPPLQAFTPPQAASERPRLPLAMRLSMPAFRCTPPECREVLFCKYFQCTSLGFFPDVRNCRRYFFCDLNSNGFVLYHMLCPKGRVFDPRIRECRLREMMGKRASGLERRRIKKEGEDGDIVYAKRESDRDEEENEDGVRSESHIVRHKVKSAKESANKKTTEETTATTTTANGTGTESGSRDVGLLAAATLATKAATLTTTTTTTPSSASFETEVRSSPMTMTTTSAAAAAAASSSLGNATSRRSDAVDMGGLDSEVYQEDMRGGEYDDCDAYDDDVDDDDVDDEDYYYYGDGERHDRLRERFDHYLDELATSKATTLTTESITSSTTWNDSVEEGSRSHTSMKVEVSGVAESEVERGKRSDRNGTATDTATSTASTDLPDFEKIYKETKRRNLDGYPCKRYARFPDKFDRESYYECGAQPDGGMRIEHKKCLKGEEFSPEFLECVATEYLRATHRRRRFPLPKFPMKQKHKPKTEPEYTYEDDKELSNEWLDASHGTKVPNEFKSKTKQTLRIFHLHCKRHSTTPQSDSSPKPKSVRSVTSEVHLPGVFNLDLPDAAASGKTCRRRSFTIRSNKKDAVEQQESIDDEDEDEYEDDDDEEEYEDALQDSEPKNERKAKAPRRDEKFNVETSSYGSRSSSMETTESGSTVTIPDASSTSTKVLLDADIRVNREFENTLRNILGKREESGSATRRLSPKRDKDSIVITLSGEKSGVRSKRNAIKDLFRKKSKNAADDPDKEGVVSMINLINGLPSEYERDALLQKLERRKMMNSHMYRSRQRAMEKRQGRRDDCA